VPRFITYFSYSGDAARAMIEHPTDRAAAGRAAVEALGGSMEAFYWMTGEHDGFLISELPDGVTAGALAAAVGSAGTVGGLETHQLFDHDERMRVMELAAKARGSYKPPTG
jgi:uncharacterized protein with GYD domain